MFSFLGDAFSLMSFLQIISELYQGNHQSKKVTYHKRRWPQPPSGAEGRKLYEELYPPGLDSYSAEDLFAQWSDQLSRCSLAEVRFTPSDIEKLYKQATEPSSEESDEDRKLRARITRQDALTAYITMLYNRVMDEPANTLRIVINVRQCAT